MEVTWHSYPAKPDTKARLNAKSLCFDLPRNLVPAVVPTLQTYRELLHIQVRSQLQHSHSQTQTAHRKTVTKCNNTGEYNKGKLKKKSQQKAP